MLTFAFVFVLFGIEISTTSEYNTTETEENSTQYLYRFIPLDADFSSEFYNIGINKSTLVTKMQNSYKKTKQQKVDPMIISGLYTILKRLEPENCLVVIDNWHGLNIVQSSAVPSIVRNLKVAFSHRKLQEDDENYEYLESVVLPTEFSSRNNTFSELLLDDDKYHNCPISSLYVPLEITSPNNAFCVDLNHQKFTIKSRPWQCEIQVSLEMPEHVLKNRIVPGLFQYIYDFKFKFMPSSRPKIHIFIGSKNSQHLDSGDLLNWLSHIKIQEDAYQTQFPYFSFGYYSQNNIHVIGQLFCNVDINTKILDLDCRVSTMTYISICIDCPKLISRTIIKNLLSLNYLSTLARMAETNLVYGSFACKNKARGFTLCTQMKHFEDNEDTAIKLPLQSLQKMKAKYSDNIQILAFALTSVFKNIIGNVTRDFGYRLSEDTNTIKQFLKICNEICKSHVFTRIIRITESFVDERNTAVSFENKFGSLRFVSCGSRGFELLGVNKFVSVFEPNVWKWFLAVETLLVIAMNLVRGSFCPLNSLDKVTSLVKVLLEQGDPFPSRFIKSRPFRFVICGALLGGLVLSSAFKSTNVYNIVLPKQPLEFSTIDELLDHNYTVYSKLKELYHNLEIFDEVPQSTEATIETDTIYKFLSITSTDDQNIFSSVTETNLVYYVITNTDEEIIGIEKELAAYLSNNTWPHLGLYDVIVEPLNILRSLTQIGLLNLTKISGDALSLSFWGKQDKFIAEDLKKCNKTAWLLPDYQAQQMTRMLHKSGEHSDVGAISYFKPNLNFHFEGAVPSTLLQRASLIPSSGLMEWWSNLINRTDLIRRKENEPPVKPKMTGNIQIVFLILPVGMSIAVSSLIFELSRYIFRIFKATFCFGCFLSQHIIKKLTNINYKRIRKTKLQKII